MSLLEMGTLKVLENLPLEKLILLDFEFHEDLSNKFLAKLETGKILELNQDDIIKLSKMFHASKFLLIGVKYGEKLFDVAYYQNLKILKIRNLNDLVERVQPVQIDWNQVEEEPVPIDITDIIKRMINEGSRGNLEQLSIDGSKTKFPNGWMEELSQFLPSLFCLDLHNCPMLPTCLNSIFNSYQNLRFLNISGSGITNITGISQLTHLRVLLMADLAFEIEEAFEDIFNLTNLEVLDISGLKQRQLDNAQLFIYSRNVLPNLRYLDVSQNVMEGNMLHMLVESHQTLEVIGLIDTYHDEHFPLRLIDSPEAEILTVIDLPNGFRSLEFYTRQENFQPERFAKIMSLINHIMSNTQALREEKDIHEFLEVMRKLREKFPKNALVDFHVSFCFVSMEGVHSIYTDEEQTSIIETLLSMCHWEWQENLQDLHQLLYANVWKYLMKFLPFIFQKELHIDEICEKAAGILEQTHNMLNPASREMIDIIQQSVLEHCSPETVQKIVQNKELKRRLIEYLDERQFDTVSRQAARLIRDFYVLQNATDYDTDLLCWSAFMRGCEARSGHAIGIISEVLWRMGDEIIKEIVNETMIRRILNIIYAPMLHSNIINILVTISHRFEKRDPLQEIPNESIQKLTSIVLKAARDFPLTEDNDPVEYFNWIIAHSRSRKASIPWAEWYLAKMEENRNQLHE